MSESTQHQVTNHEYMESSCSTCYNSKNLYTMGSQLGSLNELNKWDQNKISYFFKLSMILIHVFSTLMMKGVFLSIHLDAEMICFH